LEISQNNEAINENKQQLSSAIRLLSQEGEKSQLEILLLNNYLTEYITQVQYLQDINGKISEGLTDLKAAKIGLDSSKQNLESNKEKLRSLRSELEQNQVQLASEKDAKSYLLDETRSSEAEYQKLLNQARREQQSAAADIVSLERSMRNKINQQGGTKLPLKYDGFIWPIPSHRITATFHDPAYPFRNVFEHPAIDIGTPLGSPIVAVKSPMRRIT
jgi:peptidoglycan hydrolase CwlO-like protein